MKCHAVMRDATNMSCVFNKYMFNCTSMLSTVEYDLIHLICYIGHETLLLSLPMSTAPAAAVPSFGARISEGHQ